MLNSALSLEPTGASMWQEGKRSFVRVATERNKKVNRIVRAVPSRRIREGTLA